MTSIEEEFEEATKYRLRDEDIEAARPSWASTRRTVHEST